MPNDIDFTYQEKRSNREIEIDKLYQSYSSDCRAYNETVLDKVQWIKDNQFFINNLMRKKSNE